MSAVLFERIRDALKSDSMAFLDSEYGSLQNKLQLKAKSKTGDLAKKFSSGFLRRNFHAEHFIPESFKQGNKDCIALR